MMRWQTRIRPPVRVKTGARKRLIGHFNKLPIRESLRSEIDLDSWIDLEVGWLIVSAEKEIVLGNPLSKSDWDAEARELLERFGDTARKLDGCLQSLPPVAWTALLKEVAPKTGASLWLLPSFFEKIAEGAHRLTKRPLPKAAGGRPVTWGSRVADNIAERVARTYTLLTGKDAKPGSERDSDQRNEFENLLAKVFANLGIDASAEVQARKLRAREKTKSK